MKVYTLNVGQGQFVVVVGSSEAIIVDTFVPLQTEDKIENVKGALADIISGKNLIGLVITGFDADHFNEVGIKIVLNKYRPDWIMYPKYYKESKVATHGFSLIKEFEKQKEITRHSIALNDDKLRFFNNFSKDFSFEVFSPNKSDMDSSNNSSLVCKIIENATNRTYLVTGDTENARWNAIAKAFGNALKSDVLDAPHHGSANGITEEAIKLIKPHTVLISAGRGNKYGHPDSDAVDIFKKITDKVYCTKDAADSGKKSSSIVTDLTSAGINSAIYTPH
mgnify:CR=1 FL=1